MIDMEMDEELGCALTRRFDFKKRNIPYGDNREHLEDLLALCSLYLTVLGACRYVSAGEDCRVVLPGTAADGLEAMEYVSEYPVFPDLPPDIDEVTSAAWDYIESRVAATQEAESLLRAQRVRRALALDDYAYFALLCALGCALDRGFEQFFVSMHREAELRCPTVGTVRAAWELLEPLPPEAQALGDFSLDRNRLLYAAPSREWTPMLQPLFLRPEAAAFLTGRSCLTGALAKTEALETWEGEALFLESALEQAGGALDAAQERPAPRLTVLCGPEGSGRRTTLRLLSARRGCRFLLADLEAWPDSGFPTALSMLAAVLLEGYIPVFRMENEALRPRLLEALGIFRPHNLPVFVLAERLRGNLAAPGYLVRRVDYDTPDLRQALALWNLLGKDIPIRPELDWAALAAKFQLTPGKIAVALQTAADALSPGGALDAAAIERAILLGNTNRLSEIADPIPVFYGWEDLVLAEEPMTMLHSVCDRIRYRHQVETLWGWGAKNAYGKGISVLLYGPPGTGKTMCAQVLAGDLHLPLFRINLAQIISKYIGETAKNLDTVFNEAKNSNVVLFFDEADSLFAKRTDVKDSNDRHANSESAYLLQKIEEYSGICILATNLAHNFDEAFRRRIGYIINIPMPAPEQRLALWKACFPADAPLAADVDFTLLSGLEFSGSVIKSAAAQSAYFAAAEGGGITMSQIARAVRLELRKLGKSEPEFLSLCLRKTGGA